MTIPPYPDRRLDLDWLRVLATLNVFFFHCARMFNDEDWHVKNEVLSLPASIFIGFTSVYIMPLFFLLSAVGVTYSLQRRSSGQYLVERVKRLFVPFVFGVFVIIAPVQVWIERATHEPFYPHGFLHFMLHDYFVGWYGFGGNFAWVGIHLWYLLFLFVFSILTLPLFKVLLHSWPTRAISHLAALARRPGGLYLYAIPIVLMELLVNSAPETWGARDAGGWSAPTYLVFFIMGFILFRDRSLAPAMIDRRRLHLVVALIFTVVFFVLKFWEIKLGPPGYFVWGIGWPLASWSWLMTIFGYGGRYLNFIHRWLPYLNNLVLPFYILHQTVIVTLGYFIRGWDWPVFLKYPFVVVVCFTVIMAIYELLVRRFRVTRFLFGMKNA